jgi:hypothetical protein
MGQVTAMAKSLTSQLYRLARDSANVRAATSGYRRGGVAGAAVGTGKRIVRRKIYRTANRPLSKLLRALGL